MQPKKIKYYLLGLFLIGMALFIVLHVNSAKNIRQLISGNEQLLQELNVKNEIQKLQTSMARTDSKVRGTVIAQDSLHITGIEADIAVIKADLKEINKIVRNDSTEKLLTQLNYLVDEKNSFNVQVLDTFYTQGKWAAEKLINNQKGKRLGEAITGILHQLDSTRQSEVNRTTHLIDTSGQKALSWGAILVFFACLTSLLAFLYITSRIHRQEQLIDELDESREQERKLTVVKDQFLANMSHEIRTPMNSVLGFAHLLKNQPLNSKSREYVTAIDSAGQNLLEIINDILDISKIESGMMRIEPSSFSLRGVLHAVYMLFQPKADEKHLSLQVTTDEQVPDILYGDVTRLTQVLVNLTSNAIKFTDEGLVSIHVGKIWQDGNAVRLLFTIKDTGIGIDPAKQGSIFDRFNQAEAATTRKYGGTGLGLTIVKQLVELQNGFIAVESNPGEGTAFKVEFPYTLGEPAADPGTVEEQPVLLNGMQQDIRILVAEDNKMNQQLLRHLLSNRQLSYRIVTNGEEALLALQKHNYDLLLLDIQMPNVDGYTVIQRLRQEQHSNIPVIAMTAHAMAGEKDKCLQLGMNEYISKPIRAEELYQLIEVYTGKTLGPDISGNDNGAIVSDNGQLISMQYLQELSNGNSQFEQTMLQQFIAQIPEDLGQLKTAIETGDLPAIRAAAHHLKTTVSFIGLEAHVYPFLEPLEHVTEENFAPIEAMESFATLRQLAMQAVQEAMNLLL